MFTFCTHCTGNVNECCRCCYCCYYSHYSLTIELIQAWKRTGNDIRAWPEWEGAGPGQWYHSPSVQLSAGFRISGTLTRSHCMDMISGHQASSLLIHNTAAIPFPPSSPLSKQHSIFFPRCFLNICHAVLKFLCLIRIRGWGGEHDEI